ncbi:MAG: acyl-CoA dehydrogenase family protein, partial [Candidatus Eremiobacteraeota bacterium]|nr:acyl-CoA dehydrogenase family protein [Candidatus Eremiobacteraeota bacterium]
MIRDSVRSFAKDKILPYARDWDRAGAFPRDLLKEMGKLGFLGVPVPEEYGGAGLDYIAEAIVFEEVGYADSSVRTTLSVQMSLVELTILRYAPEELKKAYLPKLCSGEWIGCFGLTEPAAGSDPGGMKTRPTRTEGGYVLNGSKMWIS